MRVLIAHYEILRYAQDDVPGELQLRAFDICSVTPA